MLKVSVSYHKDGDHLLVYEVPWWMDGYEWLANRFCPCCGLSGLIFNLYGNEENEDSFKAKLADKHYTFWSWLTEPIFKLDKKLYEVPIESGCAASRAIWKKEEPCFRSDCEDCWHLQDDAFSNGGDDML